MCFLHFLDSLARKILWELFLLHNDGPQTPSPFLSLSVHHFPGVKSKGHFLGQSAKTDILLFSVSLHFNMRYPAVWKTGICKRFLFIKTNQLTEMDSPYFHVFFPFFFFSCFLNHEFCFCEFLFFLFFFFGGESLSHWLVG